MLFTFTIPEAWLHELVPGYAVMKQDPAQVRAAVRDVITDALTRDLKPVELPDEEGEKARFTLSLPAAQASMAAALMKTRGLTAGPLAKQLVAAMRGQAPREIAVDESDPLVALIRLLKQRDPFHDIHVRPEQVEFASNVRDSLNRGKIGLVEAGTGVGKTRAMVKCAVDYALEHDKRIVICAPTLALLGQFAREYRKQASVTDEIPDLRVVFGRREFVSECELRLLLATPALAYRYPVVEDWIDAGGKPTITSGVEACWLISTLEQLAPDFPINDVRLPEDIFDLDDRGYKAYREQFTKNREQSAELLLCTHAMLAQDLRTRQRAARRDEDYVASDKEYGALIKAYWKADARDRELLTSEGDALRRQRSDLFNDATEDKGLLPDYAALLLDEAHAFEEACSNALSRYLALRVLLRNLNTFREHKGRLAKEVIGKVESYINEISTLNAGAKGDLVNLKSDTVSVSRARYALDSIRSLIEGISTKTNQSAPKERIAAAARIRQALGILNAVSNSPTSVSYLRFSPQRSYPSLYVGATSVERILSAMWDALDAAAAISATLYLVRHDGMSASYQRIRLAIPDTRAQEYRPVVAPWSVAPIKALYTAGDRASELRPPTRADIMDEPARSVAEEAWLDNLAPVLKQIADSSAGGTLCLMTSYASVAGIAKRLEADQLPLVVAVQDYPLERQKEEFLRLRRQGKKPLWIALGGAWTGLDVGGHDPWTHCFGESLPASEDNVLTDLVIPRLPFGTNQSISHIWRVNNRPGMPWELFETVFRFKQGLGRLIRRSGLPENRKIWVLDGRIQDVNAGATYALFTQMMSNYPVRDINWAHFPE